MTQARDSLIGQTAVTEVTLNVSSTIVLWARSLQGSMADQAPAVWPSATELTPAPETPSEAAPSRDNWVYWAMLPPPPPPLSSPVAGSEPCQKGQPHVQPQPPSGELPPFDAQILPAAQPPFDAQAPSDAQSQYSGQQAWNFQASTPWYWGLSPNGFPTYHTSFHSPGKLRFLAALLSFLFLSSPSFLFLSLSFALCFWRLVMSIQNVSH